MAHHLPSFHVLVFVFLVVHTHVFPASRAGPLPTTYDGSMCSELSSSRCGSIYIRYPFYLASATGLTTDNVTTYSCGYTDLRIFCRDDGETETATIQLGQYNYTVEKISYDYGAGTVLLADPDAFLGGGTSGCPIIRHNFSFSDEWLHYTSSRDNLTFFSHCYQGEDAPPEFGEYQIHCREFNSSTGVGAAYVFTSDEHEAPRDYDLAEHCHDIVVVPVLSYSLPRKSNRPMLRSAYGDVLRNGFELAWSRTAAGGCRRCEYSDGRCAYSQNKVFLGCLCPDEKVETQYCSDSGASRTPSPSSKSLTKLIPSIASHRLYIF